MDLDQLPEPIIQAPLAGGPSTPKLAAAVGEAGGFGFLAAGYKTADGVGEDIRELRSLTDVPFGVNVFSPPAPAGDSAAVERYATRMQQEAERYGVEPGVARHDDDGYEEKLTLLAEERAAVVSFTFGCPDPAVVERLHEVESDVWVTVTNPREAVQARDAGADALVVQGFEAGGHRGYFNDDDDAEDLGLLVALRLTAAEVDLPLVAAGGIADGAGVAAVLCAGAAAAQIGTALMLTPEAGTAPAYRQALSEPRPTRLTRAFSGRRARGIVNRFMAEHDDHAPAAYPDVHHLTTPIRAAARKAGLEDAINLWAGQAYPLAREEPARDVVRRLGSDARAAVQEAGRRIP